MKRKIELTVNDELWELEIEPHRTLLEVLREDLGLTGAKEACGLGACLGCAVKVSSRGGPVYQYVCKNGPVFPARVIDWNGL